MKCKCGNEMRNQGGKFSEGWDNHRLECFKCGMVFIPLIYRMFGKYGGYPKWNTKNEWGRNLA